MIWLLLAALGVPIWLVAGALGASLWSRKRFQQAPGVFKCGLRQIAGDALAHQPGWPRLPTYARWVHDVLIVHAGLALVRNAALPVASVEPMDASDAVPAPKRLGGTPLIVRLRLDDGSIVALAAPLDAAILQRGPFTVEAVPLVELRAG